MEELRTIDDAHELIRLTRSGEVNFAGLMKLVTPAATSAALNALRDGRYAMNRTESDFANSPKVAELRGYLSAIGAKLAPTMSPAAASAWIDALCISISKWPTSVALGAARRARHAPIKHGVNGVDEVLHSIAAELDERQRATLALVETLCRETNRATTVNRIEQQPMVWTQPAIDDANYYFRRLGVRTRYELVDGECVSTQEPLFTIEDAQRETAEFDSSAKDGHIPEHGGNHEEE